MVRTVEYEILTLNPLPKNYKASHHYVTEAGFSLFISCLLLNTRAEPSSSAAERGETSMSGWLSGGFI